MIDDEGHPHFSETAASGGEKNHHVRYILAISLLLAIAAMSAAWIIPAILR